jgi:succinoglycan biosynthesis transport protein ExoP
MSQHRQPASTPAEVIKLLKAHRRSWLIPMVIVAGAAFIYSLVRPATWEASLALTVRDEAAGGDRPGKFHVVEDMKTVQETILELAKSHSVLAATLKQVGPQNEVADRLSWPSDQDVAALQGAVRLSPPHGAEFGKTEVFYLQVQSHDHERAVALASALGDQLKQRFADLRDSKAQSMVDELTKTATLSQADLKTASDRLAKIDAKVGSDLGELRILADDVSGDSPLRRSVTEMETELRAARAVNDSNQELLRLLEGSKDGPKPLLAAPSRLLESQPALRRLKDSLVDAQLRTDQLLGNMAGAHPHVLAAKAAEEEIARQIRAEVQAAIGVVSMELHLSSERCAILDKQLASAKQRLSHLAEIRTDYANLAAEVHRRTDTLKTAESHLAEARASQASAHTASLISRLDVPETGVNPIGPSRTVIVAAGAAGGLLFGLAILFLTIQPSQPVETEVDEAAQAWILSSARVNGPGRSAPFKLVNGDSHPSNGHPSKSLGDLSFRDALTKIENSKRPSR